ncbi:MAG: hypothetical protein KAW87_01005 [Candidatus Cloacimonetes bacterium]|nr:hypothetical protein [Candidatus Cloacimonadota bacterium]
MIKKISITAIFLLTFCSILIGGQEINDIILDISLPYYPASSTYYS